MLRELLKFDGRLNVRNLRSGYGGLSVVLEGPHRSDIECYEAKDRKYTIHYSPHEPGIYILNIRFADEHVPGEHTFEHFCMHSRALFIW